MYDKSLYCTCGRTNQPPAWDAIGEERGTQEL